MSGHKPTWRPLDRDAEGESDPAEDIKAMREAMRDTLDFGFNPAKEFPTHVLRHECGHVAGYYRVWLPEKYQEVLRGEPCPMCQA